ncbi:MAG: class I SAM-dependent rRNA methyltransferase [Acidobacteriota bacterium]
MQSIRVSRKAVARLSTGHPWIFTSDLIDKKDATGGSAVAVNDPAGRALGVAHYSDSSLISLRMLDRGRPTVDAAFYRKRIETAAAMRARRVRDTDAYRLVHAEADLLPGLVIDRYGDCFVLQALTQGMDAAQPWIVEALIDLFAPRAIVARNDAAVRDKENLDRTVEVVYGEAPEFVELGMNGMRWRTDLLHGQKTGVFLDQRENYQAVRNYAHGRALDCFTCTGGFALHLASVCEQVDAVDSSEEALKSAEWNKQANSITNVHFREADMFDLLAAYSSSRRTYDTVVLDPPALAKSRSAVEAAARAYRELNTRALRLLPPGGVLVSCSCSHHMNEAALLSVIAEASLETNRSLRVLERRTQSLDHPILLTVPETSYLKCLIFEVL